MEHDDGCPKTVMAQIRNMRQQGVSRGDRDLEQKLQQMHRALAARFCVQRAQFRTKVLLRP